MAASPTIRQIRIAVYRYPRQDLTVDLGFAAGAFYEPGSVVQQPMLGVRIVSDTGVTGEYLSAAPGALEQIRIFAPFLIGKDALQRELFYNQAKYILRKHDRIGIGPIDIALWDLAGKLHQAPIYRLLGGYRTKLPVYASTLPRRPTARRTQFTPGLRRLRRAVPGDGLPRLQDPLLG